MKHKALVWGGLALTVGALAITRVPAVLAQLAPPAENKGIAAKVIGSIALAPEISSVDNRQLRMRVVTMAPGGVFAIGRVIPGSRRAPGIPPGGSSP